MCDCQSRIITKSEMFFVAFFALPLKTLAVMIRKMYFSAAALHWESGVTYCSQNTAICLPLALKLQPPPSPGLFMKLLVNGFNSLDPPSGRCAHISQLLWLCQLVSCKQAGGVTGACCWEPVIKLYWGTDMRCQLSVVMTTKQDLYRSVIWQW